MLKEAMNLDQAYKNYIEKLIKRKPYQLSQETEKVLAAFSAVFDGPSELYDITKMIDIQFPNFKVDNKEYPLSYVSFEGNWESEVNTSKDRKSTRLNSSHVAISYAVFCLKK